MNRFLESIFALIIEIIGLVGSIPWAIKANWDYEPVILLSVSSIGIIYYVFRIIIKDKNRPYVDVELIRGSCRKSAPKFVKESPKKDGHFTYEIKGNAVYHFEFEIDYKLIIRNNSTFLAYNPRIYINTKELTYSAQGNYSDPISNATPRKIDLELKFNKKMTHSDSEIVLLKSNTPVVISNLKIIIAYQNDIKNQFFTFYSSKGINTYFKKLKINNEYQEIKY